MKLEQILKDSNYNLSQFTEYTERLENSIFEKELKNGKEFYVNCLVRKKDIKLGYVPVGCGKISECHIKA